jgi:prepilin-type N-terminal cleavage/methylation domain-containing protein
LTRFLRSEPAGRHGGRARRADGGFTLIELSVTMAILLVVTSITFGLIVGIEQQNTNVQATIGGARQAQIASTALVQYLRAAVQIAASPPVVLVGSPTPVQEINTPASTTNATSSSLGVVTYTGNPSNGVSPTLVPVYAAYTAGAPNHGFDVGTGKLSVTFGYGTSTQTVKTFDVVAPSPTSCVTACVPQIFTYYEYTPPPYGSGNPQGSLQALSSGALGQTNCLANIVAVRLQAIFLAGPGATPTRGFAADVATDLNTLIFLHNATDYGISPTTTTVAVTGQQSCYS